MYVLLNYLNPHEQRVGGRDIHTEFPEARDSLTTTFSSTSISYHAVLKRHGELPQGGALDKLKGWARSTISSYRAPPQIFPIALSGRSSLSLVLFVFLCFVCMLSKCWAVTLLYPNLSTVHFLCPVTFC